VIFSIEWCQRNFSKQEPTRETWAGSGKSAASKTTIKGGTLTKFFWSKFWNFLRIWRKMKEKYWCKIHEKRSLLCWDITRFMQSFFRLFSQIFTNIKKQYLSTEVTVFHESCTNIFLSFFFIFWESFKISTKKNLVRVPPLIVVFNAALLPLSAHVSRVGPRQLKFQRYHSIEKNVGFHSRVTFTYGIAPTFSRKSQKTEKSTEIKKHFY